MSSVEVLLTSKGKPCLVVDGYQHRIVKKDCENIHWLCLRYEKSKCSGSVKTDLQNVILSQTDHSCVPNLAEIEVKKALQKCRKRAMEDTSVPVHQIFKEEMTPIYDKGFEFVTKTPKYSNVKSALNSQRRKVVGTKVRTSKKVSDMNTSGQLPCSTTSGTAGNTSLATASTYHFLLDSTPVAEQETAPTVQESSNCETMEEKMGFFPKSVKFLHTSKGKPCLAVDGYQHRIVKKDCEKILWLCMRYEKSKCRGSVKTDLQNVILSQTEHSCVPNAAEIEVKKALQNCKKRAREDISVPVHQIFKEEMTPLYDKGFEFVTETPKYSNVKSALNSQRRKVLGTNVIMNYEVSGMNTPEQLPCSTTSGAAGNTSLATTSLYQFLMDSTPVTEQGMTTSVQEGYSNCGTLEEKMDFFAKTLDSLKNTVEQNSEILKSLLVQSNEAQKRT